MGGRGFGLSMLAALGAMASIGIAAPSVAEPADRGPRKWRGGSTTPPPRHVKRDRSSGLSALLASAKRRV